MTAKHTPGPWSMRDAADRERVNDGAFAVAARSGDVLAVVRFPFTSVRTGEVAEANAKLIAAAPEQQAKIDALADALEAMLLNARSHKDCPRSLPSLPVAQAEAALRATGRLP